MSEEFCFPNSQKPKDSHFIVTKATIKQLSSNLRMFDISSLKQLKDQMIIEIVANYFSVN